ncbi:MAG: heavy metal-responsive transcriptional regulator [Gammaproteobacteria bacterium]|nr:heavy metal-responsive transcriptional regulator [Gammaproteobacteria bacterium]MDH5654146.1 heavy metal-responsive transcriptional regulator [Gammaproteobacteria bacterium]
MNIQTDYKIGDIAELTGVSTDTLRYYEKIGLLSNIKRTDSGLRLYSDRDVSRLKFIKRAQRMNFSLDEIRDLLAMREDPQQACTEVRQITSSKLQDIEAHLEELTRLRNELALLLNLCQASEEGCPIIDDLDTGKQV